MKILLLISGILAILIGIAAVFATKGFFAGTGVMLDDKTATLGQAQGVMLIALGTINLLSRGVEFPRAVLAGNAVAQFGSLAINVRALVLSLVSSQVGGAIAMHVVLGGLFIFFLVRGPKKAA